MTDNIDDDFVDMDNNLDINELPQEEKKEELTEEEKIKKYVEKLKIMLPFSILPLIELIKETISEDLTEKIFEGSSEILKQSNTLRLSNDTEAFELYLDIVDKDYEISFGNLCENENNKKKILECSNFLIGSVVEIFEFIKKKEYTETLNKYENMQVTKGGSLFLDEQCEKKIGMVLKKVVNEEKKQLDKIEEE